MTVSRLILAKTGLKVYKNKTLSELTDQECEEARDYITETTGIIYASVYATNNNINDSTS